MAECIRFAPDLLTSITRACITHSICEIIQFCYKYKLMLHHLTYLLCDVLQSTATPQGKALGYRASHQPECEAS